MPEPLALAPEAYVLLTLVALCAGFIDSIAGGGGLITVPSMLSFGIPPLQVLGTNKLQSSLGTSMACWNYARKGLLDWRSNMPTVIAVALLAALGAWVVQSIDTRALNLIVPILLILVAGYVLFSPRMGDTDAHQRVSATGYMPIGGAIGFYDGFFGPGTGAFFTASLVGLRGHSLIRATALTKLFNLTSNLASVVLFALGGKMLWLLGLCMAIGAIAGGWLGSHTAIRFGARVIRPLLVTISLLLTCRLIWSYFSA